MFNVAYKQGKESPAGFSLSGFFRALLVAILVSVVFLIAGALLLTYTALPESTIPFVALLSLLLGVIASGASFAANINHHGYLNGGIMGLCYGALLYLVSFFVAGRLYLDGYVLIVLLIGLFGGAIGGIIGINRRGKQRR
ncbi:MAG: TIGR04086 family membrane protein [Ruminococcaceae bacterium]|nr:TIGR04086 family membrane protein [Oscillospiraceae bacterium]